MNTASSLKRFAIVVATLAVFALLTIPAFGQTIDGTLTGTVYDPSGAAVNGAEVTVTNVATGQSQTATTKTLGDYRFNDLPVGTYNITASSPNFKTTTLTNIPVDLNKIGTANIKLEVGSSATTVEVSGVAPPVDTTSAQLQSTYDSRYSQDLGITSAGANGAGVLNLSLLSPGVTNSSAMGLGVGPSVGGQRPRDNNFTVEGVDNNNKSVTGALIMVPNDAVENFTLLENQFNAEFGHSSGGQFNTTIKSGTNSFHGSVYEYFRNRNMNAVDNYYVLQGITENPRFDSNRYGGTLGGPLVKNKLFFFTNFERQPVGQTGTSGLEVLSPTAAGYAAIATDPGVSANNLAIFKQYMPVAPAAIGSANGGCIEYDTGTVNRPSKGTYNAPANGGCPAGTVEAGAITFAAPAFSNYENFVQSADYNMSEKDQIRGRYVFNKLDQIDTQASLPAFYLIEPFRFYLFTLGEYHTFTPSLLNEFRVGYNRYANTLPAGNFKYPGLDAFPNILLGDLNGVNIGPDSNAPQFTIQNFYNGVDNVTWTKGAHTLKFGAEYRWYISPQQFTQRQRGDYEYNTTQMFLEDFSPDIIGERSQGASIYSGDQKGIYWYANDNWRVNTHLSLNLGVRWEYNSVPTGEQRQSLNAISSQPQIIVPGVNEPLVFSKIDSPKKNFAPRLGFAYSPGESGNTSIRGGFGLAYDVLYDNIGILAVPPQVGATNDVPDLNNSTANFLGSGGLNGGGSGVTPNCNAAFLAANPSGNCVDAIASTSAWIPPHTKWPYSINWNLGIQHSFGKNFTAEINYVGDRGVHLDAQSRINRRSLVSPSAYLPTYLQAPSQATLDALPNTLTSLKAPGNVIPAYRALACDDPNFGNSCTFGSSITADLPLGSSNYNGLETQLQRRFSNGLSFQAAYTYSRTIDNDTADFFSTSLTPRRPQDFQNFAAERSVSPLSRTHRFTIAAVYDLPFFKSGNWLMKNVVGNWGFSPIYTYESPEWATVQSFDDANLNGDGSAGDRAVFNPAGTPGTGSGVTALHNTGGQVVAYLAKNPSAQYITAGAGALATAGRDTLPTRPTDDLDLGVYKDLNITERVKFRLGAQVGNILNHPQYIPGSNPGAGLGVNDVNSFNSTAGGDQNYVNPNNANFLNPKSVFASNARTIGIVGKITF